MHAHSLPALGNVNPIPPTPLYQGVSRRKTSPERKIDDLYAAGDLDATIEAILDHVSHKYLRAPYLTKGDLNWPLADAVAFHVLRSLPGYDGPAAKLTPFDETRVPLSSYCNLIAKCRHLDLARECTAIKEHEVLACELIKPGAEDYDVLTYISDVKQANPDAKQHMAGGRGKMKAADKHHAFWRGQRYKLYDPEVRLIVGEAIARLNSVDRSVIRACSKPGFDTIKGETARDFRRVLKRLRLYGKGWHQRARKYDLAAIRASLHCAGGLLATYEDYIGQE